MRGRELEIIDVAVFPISRDPPEGGTWDWQNSHYNAVPKFPISRDPPEGGTNLELA